MVDLDTIKSKGYDKNLDKVYVLSEPKIDKYLKKKPSLLQKAINTYSEEACIETLNKDLQ